eukprot:9130372-Alexandrium_andersonii.AAC.1
MSDGCRARVHHVAHSPCLNGTAEVEMAALLPGPSKKVPPAPCAGGTLWGVRGSGSSPGEG